MVSISTLALGCSPRLNGEDSEHTLRLAETEETLPPILVHRSTMQVIDGAHRVRAAQLNGEDSIAAYFYEGDCDTAFVVAVERNMAHGLPLSTADRQAAARRIISTHPQWSDRAIAARTGLSARTVRAIRSTADLPQSNERLGRDGRLRPLTAADGRRRASEILAREPATPLRKVARAAGVSLATAHDVRQRLQRGLDPVPGAGRATAEPDRATRPRADQRSVPTPDPMYLTLLLRRLVRDPSLKYTDAGRSFLHWLDAHVITNKDWAPFAETVPPHGRHAVADIARRVACNWHDFAKELERLERLERPRPAQGSCAERQAASWPG
jgi:ParB-like chromosome segregation protein Spo0J